MDMMPCGKNGENFMQARQPGLGATHVFQCGTLLLHHIKSKIRRLQDAQAFLPELFRRLAIGLRLTEELVPPCQCQYRLSGLDGVNDGRASANGPAVQNKVDAGQPEKIFLVIIHRIIHKHTFRKLFFQRGEFSMFFDVWPDQYHHHLPIALQQEVHGVEKEALPTTEVFCGTAGRKDYLCV